MSVLCNLIIGTELKTLSQGAKGISVLSNASKRKMALKDFTTIFTQTLSIIKRTVVFGCIPFVGRIPLLFLLLKFMNVAIMCGHFVLINVMVLKDPKQVFSTNVTQVLWAVDVLLERIDPHQFFPRVMMCDVDILGLGFDRKFTVQCSLNVNFLNEKLFLFLWFYFAFLSLLTLTSFLSFLMTLLPCHSYLSVKKRLEAGGIKAPWKQVYGFVNKLGCDGIALIHCIQNCSTETTTVEVVCQLYMDYQDGLSLKQVVSMVATDEHCKTL